jgi:YD repeat-containing protein
MTSCCYDGNGNLTKAIDKRGATVTIAYDGNNRITEKTTPVTPAINQLASYTYNTAGLVTTESISGANVQTRTKTYGYTNGFLTSITNNAG